MFKFTKFQMFRDRNDWSSENDEADREVAAVIEKSKGKETPKECEKEKYGIIFCFLEK